MMTHETIQQAISILLREAPPGSKVVLFGSHARGEAGGDSDLDFLVIEPQVHDRLGEMARLSACLGKALIPADVVVLSQASFERWKDTPNTLACRARKEGKVHESVA